MQKECTGCHAPKPFDEFSRSSKGDRFGLRARCKECEGAYNRDWNKRNRDRVNAAGLRWKERNPDKVKRQKAAWRLSNPDKVRQHKRTEYARHRDKIIARVERWNRANPDQKRAYGMKRRAKARNGYTSGAKLRARYDFYGGRCYYCGDPATCLDHRIPLARGGAHLPGNLVPACHGCNSRKYTRTEREFLLLAA